MKRWCDKYTREEIEKINNIRRYGEEVWHEEFYRKGCNILYIQVRYDKNDKLYDIWLMNGEPINVQVDGGYINFQEV